MPTWISKSYKADAFGSVPTDLEEVEMFRDRVTGWHIDIAREIVRQIETSSPTDVMKHAGYAVLSILVNYFEMIWKYRQGHTSHNFSSEYFARGFKDVYPGFPLVHD